MCGQQKQSKTPTTSSTAPVHQLLGAADAQTAHHTTSSTAPAHQLLGSANAETTPAGAPAAAADKSSDPTQHAKGRTGDCPGPSQQTATRRNVTQGDANAFVCICASVSAVSFYCGNPWIDLCHMHPFERGVGVQMHLFAFFASHFPPSQLASPNDRHLCPGDWYRWPNDRYLWPNDWYRWPNDRYLWPNPPPPPLGTVRGHRRTR